MTADKPSAFVPRLRFPEFADQGEWDAEPLDTYCERLTETVGDSQLTPVSITAGKGFVPQSEKFGRDISGTQYSKYLWLRRGDFAYNRGNSKRFPQGCVYQLTECDEVAASNAFHCFRLNDHCEPAFFRGLFESNMHGRQLVKDITSGARGTGLLNISADTFFKITIPMPKAAAEQQKIADCLGSLDDLIAAEDRKLEALRQHKQGLMQHLFPRPGETVPGLRFPEFEDAGEWEEKRLSSLVKLVSGVHLSADRYKTTGEVPYFTGPSDFTDSLQSVAKWTDKSANTAKRHDTLITVKGSGVGEIWYLTLPSVAMGRQLMAVRAEVGDSRFVYHFLSTRRAQFQALASGNLIPGLSRGDILDMAAHFPSQDEQQRIADCLTPIDKQLDAQAGKLDTLKQHKQGLLQQLFPSPQEGH